MLHLGGDRRNAAFMQHSQLSRDGAQIHAAPAAVVTDAVEIGDVDDRVAVNVVDDRNVYVRDGPIVGEDIAVPIAAFKSAAHIAEAVVDAAIETDMLPPVTAMPTVVLAGEVPIRRSPERADVGSHDPDTGHPVVTRVGIAPGTGRPDVVFTGALWLRVFRKRRRGFCRFDGWFGIVNSRIRIHTCI